MKIEFGQTGRGGAGAVSGVAHVVLISTCLRFRRRFVADKLSFLEVLGLACGTEGDVSGSGSLDPDPGSRFENYSVKLMCQKHLTQAHMETTTSKLASEAKDSQSPRGKVSRVTCDHSLKCSHDSQREGVSGILDSILIIRQVPEQEIAVEEVKAKGTVFRSA